MLADARPQKAEEGVLFNTVLWACHARRLRLVVGLALASAGLAACATRGPSSSVPGPTPLASAPPAATRPGGRLHGTDAPYQVAGHWYYPHAQPDYDEVGTASWYDASSSYNRHTADGEIFDETLPSAAHKTLPLPCIVEVTNLANGRRARIRVNDRGPFVGGRILDLSRAAAEELGYAGRGVTQVRVRYLGPAPRIPASGMMIARAAPTRTPAPVPEPAAVSAPDDAAPGSATEATATPVNSDPVPVAPPPVASPALTTLSPAQHAPGFGIQAGAFQSRSSAERAAAQLADAGATRIEPVQRNGTVLYRVVLSGFPDRDAAAGALNHVINAGFVGAHVVGAE